MPILTASCWSPELPSGLACQYAKKNHYLHQTILVLKTQKIKPKQHTFMNEDTEISVRLNCSKSVRNWWGRNLMQAWASPEGCSFYTLGSKLLSTAPYFCSYISHSISSTYCDRVFICLRPQIVSTHQRWVLWFLFSETRSLRKFVDWKNDYDMYKPWRTCLGF